MKKFDFIETDYRNRFNRRIWLEQRLRDLNFYYETRNINCGAIPKEPFWCVVPHTSIWQIPSIGTPGFDGWFGIAGDHPTDVVPLNYFDNDPRHILEHFVEKWLRASVKLKAGEDYGDFRIEHIEQRPTIGELIEDRALKLKLWVEREELWKNVVPLDIPLPKYENSSKDEIE